MPAIFRPVLRHGKHATLALLLTLAGGLTAPFTPVVHAATVTATTGSVELSPTPPNQTQAVPPNIVVTFDDSGSMAWDYMSDTAPFVSGKSWTSGPWYCAGAIDVSATSGLGTLPMNGVYYNPNVTYTPPVKADGTSFPNANISLTAVQNDGVTANRPLSPSGSGSTTNFLTGIGWNKTVKNGAWTWGPFPSGTFYYSSNSQSNPPASSNNGTSRNSPPSKGWTCPYDKSKGNSSPVSSNGPYYYRYTGPTLTDDGFGNPSNTGALYTTSNWTAVAVPSSQYQNWANWWAYYHTRNLMARTSLSRVFGSSSLAAKTSDDGYGSSIRVAWQNLNVSDFKLPATAIISALVDTSSCADSTADPQTTQTQGAVTVPPACYRSAFFNWIFQVPASGSTPTRSALQRAGDFFTRGAPKTSANGTLEDPYWQPPAVGNGDGDELSCRQNFHVLMTDGLWNIDSGLPTVASLAQPTTSLVLPDKTPFGASDNADVTAIYAPKNDSSGAVSLSDLAFHYWATDLRPDLYRPDLGKFVAPYLPDTRTGVTPTTTNSFNAVNNANVNNEVYFNPKNDPANWPHMSEYLIGLGVSGVLNISDNTDCTLTTGASTDACDLRKGLTNSRGSVGWPTPNGSGSGIAANIDDTWHAALAGRGQFFSAGNPQSLVDQLSSVLSNISARGAAPTISAINASVLTTGALAFTTGYSSIDWTGVLKAYALNADGTTGGFMWDGNANLSDVTPDNRKILTASMDATGTVTGMAFQASSAFDASQQTGLMTPAPTDTTNDNLKNRVNYLRGERGEEASNVMRKRNSLLGAIINSQGVYVSYPSSGYTNNWPVGSPEALAAAATNGTTDDKSYDTFVTHHENRDPTLYVGANDGMMHAFYAPVPTCSATDPITGVCTGYTNPTSPSGEAAGDESWAYVPRAVYANLGNLTSASSFSFAPTVDGTPVVRDVFFSESTADEWHTILVGGLRLGGRGVYALDITDPSAVTEANAASKVLWEFDADAPAGTTAAADGGTAYDPADLGFTYGQPNVGRVKDGTGGKWVVIVPSGYFPDCSQTDRPVICNSTGYPSQPKDASTGNTYSSLFVLDAQTGAVIRELKTPNTIASYGLSSPVFGDYNNDQVDDVAFAGDLAGNLWRFDFSNADPSKWSVTQAYAPTNPGYQPITVMPRLFPDPTTNRFLVVFGTGKYLGAGDNTSVSAQTQSIYGIRDELDSSGNPVPITHGELVQQTLSESAGTGVNAGATLRSVTSNPVPASDGGWYIDLNISTAAGERVVVTPAAIFSSNTVIISTLIPGSSDPCNPTVQGAVMAFDATTGGPGLGISSLGGVPYVGARVDNVRTSGSLPAASQVGGGSLLLPGLTLTGKKTDPNKPLALDTPIWRRRSWLELNNGQ
ncbi:MAG: PilC/PilY family type IV pilus protein [Rhodanobacter sp.]|jgi:type IV pilus assembly protein PilY1